MESTTPKAESKKNWSLSHHSFGKLLDWFDEGEDSGGKTYLEMRHKLVAYFDRKNCLAPDELADETLNRVARRLEEEGAITDATPAHYCYIVAKFVFLEYLRSAQHQQANLDETNFNERQTLNPHTENEWRERREENERRLECLESCLQKLNADERQWITEYYQGERRAKIDNRRTLAEKLGISVNALSIRACRLRNRLETCVKKCLSKFQ
ncbi:MAG: hypothetical protein AB1757_09035 [Acidobacteriota bacterium]